MEKGAQIFFANFIWWFALRKAAHCIHGFLDLCSAHQTAEGARRKALFAVGDSRRDRDTVCSDATRPAEVSSMGIHALPFRAGSRVASPAGEHKELGVFVDTNCDLYPSGASRRVIIFRKSD